MKLYRKHIEESIISLQKIKDQLTFPGSYYDSITRKVVNPEEIKFTVKLNNKEVCNIIEKVLNTNIYREEGRYKDHYFRSHNLSVNEEYFLKNKSSRNFIVKEESYKYPLMSAKEFIQRFKYENI